MDQISRTYEVDIDPAELETRLAALSDRLDEGTRQLKTILAWFKEFEEFVSWMHENGFWDGQDIDGDIPMKTYKNGLIRFCKEHNIKLERP